ncbi:UNVERIFIED_CONTAM: hypothetical protein NCL1_08418 [Trichonephila clavipes]
MDGALKRGSSPIESSSQRGRSPFCQRDTLYKYLNLQCFHHTLGLPDYRPALALLFCLILKRFLPLLPDLIAISMQALCTVCRFPGTFRSCSGLLSSSCLHDAQN